MSIISTYILKIHPGWILVISLFWMVACIGEVSSIKVLSEDHNLILSFHPEDFVKNFNKNSTGNNELLITKTVFNCQYDTLFSNILWEINPKNIELSHPVKITIYYTHEEFVPKPIIENLMIFSLNREYVNDSFGDNENRMFRFSDMKLIENSVHHPGQFKVVAEIHALGDLVLGMDIETN